MNLKMVLQYEYVAISCGYKSVVSPKRYLLKDIIQHIGSRGPSSRFCIIWVIRGNTEIEALWK